MLTRTESGKEDHARKASLVALTGRLIDLSAGLLYSKTAVTEEEQARLVELSGRVDQIREFRGLSYSEKHEHLPLKPAGAGFLQLLESTVQLAHDALQQPDLMQEYTDREHTPRVRTLKPDAFTNPAHLTFALRGTVAALICYMAYHLFAWGGLNSSVATCMITALSTTGSSRQKQILRVAGAITGGLFIAIAAEVFLFPHMDSIAEFTLLFAAVTALSSWFASSSPRLSYFGLQVAFAFYIVQLRAFSPDLQLAPARDNVAGIILGLLVMWVVFDQLAPPRDSVLEMKRNLIVCIRSVVRYMQEREHTTRSEYLKRMRALRDSINERFNTVRSNADAVLFEFGRNRPSALKVRADVRAWQPEVRTLFLLQITLAHMRLREPTACLPAAVEHVQESCVEVLNELANLLEQGHVPPHGHHGGPHQLSPAEKHLAEHTVAGSLALDSLVIAEDLLNQVRKALNN